MVWCKIPEFCEKIEIDNGIYDPKSKILLRRNVKQKDKYVHIQKKINILLFGKKTREFTHWGRRDR